MINGAIYKDVDSGDILIKVGQNYKTHIFIRSIVNIGDIKFVGTCIFKENELKSLEEIILDEKLSEKLKLSLDQVFSVFVDICDKHEKRP